MHTRRHAHARAPFTRAGPLSGLPLLLHQPGGWQPARLCSRCNAPHGSNLAPAGSPATHTLEPRLGQIAQSGVPREQLYIAGSVLSDVSVGERPARLETARACAETSRTLSLYRRALTDPSPNPEPRCAESRAVLAAGGVESLDMLLLERPGALGGVRVRVGVRSRGRSRGMSRGKGRGRGIGRVGLALTPTLALTRGKPRLSSGPVAWTARGTPDPNLNPHPHSHPHPHPNPNPNPYPYPNPQANPNPSPTPHRVRGARCRLGAGARGEHLRVRAKGWPS